METYRSLIEAAWQEPALLSQAAYQQAVEAVIGELDAGRLRCATPKGDGSWEVHAWVKAAILLYFRLRKVEPISAGDISFYDKIPTKTSYSPNVRVVPPGVARYGSYLGAGVILMPGYVNIGAYVGEGSMVDTWATVGSCAQIGRGVHLSGGVGIGGVLEPPQARPVIIEDGAFIGSRAIIVEGVHVGEKAIIGAGTILTASIPVIDVTAQEAREYRGYVPPRAVVISGMREKTFPGGRYQVPCALIIGWRKPEHDEKLALNDLLREMAVPV
ncbi:MAG: 2,3,4,5-tetrahydropyridine-2,6-dicarboxylate N-succinyltransferase [Bacteroidia bacterium]|nr:2,3,4,5-tetrahydropyridine-2,6-dicarboxylate N-succinyltransferase [Bacteroidia bacterium]MCX7651927.1 2,3,4,5-tetrahydropyridine-2,6-dicarboxylate N-succinyltransferase [Bacteroidia bacterium]MDW8416078.1 2,3,4,5-tetrahydropyridine-2,6-dicarboxylate N-succinyltransferase [Bacteroidia bacterium]